MEATFTQKFEGHGGEGVLELEAYIPIEDEPLMQVPAPKRDGYIAIEYPEIATVEVYATHRTTTVHQNTVFLGEFLNQRNGSWGRGAEFWKILKGQCLI